MSLNEDLLPDPVLEVPTTVSEAIPQEDVKKLPDETFFASTAVAGEVPKFAPVFLEQKEQAEHLVDLATTQNQIQSQGAISVENAVVIDSLMPGFINENNPKELFTKTPTKTQYNESLLSIASQVDSQYVQLKSSIEETTAQFFTAANETRTRLMGLMVTGLSDLNRAIAKALITFDREDPCQIPYIFNNRKKLADLLRDSFHALTGDGVLAEGEEHACPYDGTAAAPHLTKLREITRGNRDLIDTIELLLYTGSENVIRLNGTQYVIDDGKLERCTDEVQFKFERTSMARIIELLASDELRDRFKQLDEVFIGYQNFFQSVPGKIAEIEKDQDQTTFEKLQEITELSGECVTGQMRIQAIINIVSGMVGVLQVMACMFHDLSDQQ